MDSRRRLDLTEFQSQPKISWKYPAINAIKKTFFFKAACLWGGELLYFLTSEHEIDGAHSADWIPIRPLGQGGFGVVGLWQRFDDSNEAIDSMAIKQQEYRRTDIQQRTLTLGNNGLAKEAFLMNQLNLRMDPHIIWLRDFKNKSPERAWRFYFEFAPWSDLSVLKANYRAWNVYFPEEFLWHLFHGLARAALQLSTGLFERPVFGTGQQTRSDETAYVVHFDLKPENIFLSEPIDPEDEDEDDHYFSNYPTVKMADFGVAQMTRPSDLYNPSAYRASGTRGYRPPVSCLDKLCQPSANDEYRSKHAKPLLGGADRKAYTTGQVCPGTSNIQRNGAGTRRKEL